MNNKKKILFGGSLQPNTFIGNVANLYPTAADLASVLSVTVDQISVFKVVGNDIQCFIGVDYQTTYRAFQDAAITGYIDTQGRCTGLGFQTFRFCGSLNELKLDSVTSLDTQAHTQNVSMLAFEYPSLTNTTGDLTFYRCRNVQSFILPLLENCVNEMFRMITSDGAVKQKVVYIPNATVLGDSPTLNNGVFDDILNTAVVYVNPFVMTVNGGNPDPDIQYLIDRGNDVRPVTDFTIPNNVTDLHTTNVYSDRVEIEWTAPTSTNVIDWYIIYLNGNFYGRTVGNETNFAFKDLNADKQYVIQIVAVDYFFNRSLLSNITTVITSEIDAIPSNLNTDYIGETYIDVKWDGGSYYGFYDVYVDNVFYKTVQSNATISGLVSGNSYSIKVANQGELIFSNEINVLVNGVNAYPIDNVVAYYNFNNNVDDSAGTNNGTPTDITYAPAKAGDGAVFNGTTSSNIVPNNTDLSFPSTPFTLSYFIKNDDISKLTAPISKDKNDSINREYLIVNNNTYSARIILQTGNENISAYTQTPYNQGEWYHVIYTYDGGVLATGIKIYINGVLQPLTYKENALFTGMSATSADLNFGNRETQAAQAFNGELDGVNFMRSVVVNDSQALAMYNKQNNGQELI